MLVSVWRGSARVFPLALLLGLGTLRPASAATIVVNAGGNLQTAINQAQPGDVISVQAGATFTGPFTLPNKAGSTYITIQSSAIGNLPPGNRVLASQAQDMPKLVASAAPVVATADYAHHWRLEGLEIKPSTTSSRASGDLVTLGSYSQDLAAKIPHHLVIDRCYIHAFAGQNMKRGIMLNSAWSDVTNCLIAEIHSTIQESHGIGGWNGPGPYNIINNRIEAAGENIIFGGAPSSVTDAQITPSDIVVRENYLYKPLAWKSLKRGYVVKNLFELKTGLRVTVESNYMENCWVGADQHGYAILLTVRGDNPWNAIKDVTLTNNVIRGCPRGLQLLGNDSPNPSGTLERVTVRNNLWREIGIPDSQPPRFLQIVHGCTAVTLDHNTIFHEMEGIVMVDTVAPSPSFTFTNNIMKHNNRFLWYVAGDYTFHFGGTGLFRRNVITGGVTSDVPNAADNFTWPPTLNEVGFVDYAGGNYRLAASSPFKGQATDGTDVGCNIDALAAAEAVRF